MKWMFICSLAGKNIDELVLIVSEDVDKVKRHIVRSVLELVAFYLSRTSRLKIAAAGNKYTHIRYTSF